MVLCVRVQVKRSCPSHGKASHVSLYSPNRYHFTLPTPHVAAPHNTTHYGIHAAPLFATLHHPLLHAPFRDTPRPPTVCLSMCVRMPRTPTSQTRTQRHTSHCLPSARPSQTARASSPPSSFKLTRRSAWTLPSHRRMDPSAASKVRGLPLSCGTQCVVQMCGVSASWVHHATPIHRNMRVCSSTGMQVQSRRQWRSCLSSQHTRYGIDALLHVPFVPFPMIMRSNLHAPPHHTATSPRRP